MPNSEPASDPSANQPDASQSVWAGRAGPIFWAGLGVGLLLAIGGFVALSGALVGNTTGMLILCSGLGVIFGAFGSTGTANYKGVVITGVAAIAIILLLVVDHLVKKNYVELAITGDIRGAQVEVVGDVNYLGAPRNRSHDFIIIGREIRTDTVSVTISLPPGTESEEGSEYFFECVPKNEIERHLGSGQIIQWRFDMAKGQLFDSNAHRKIADVGPCQELADAEQHIDSRAGHVLAALASSVFPQAFAQEPADTQMLLQELESESAYTRRQARQALAQQGLPAVRPMLDRLSVDRPSYRIRVGTIVAMTEMLRKNKGDRQKISALLTEDDLNNFIDASTDRDRTVRVYASEFLYDLGDPRVLPSIFERFDTADENGKYNLLVVLDGVYPDLDTGTRKRIDQKLSDVRGNVGAKTQQLIDSIVGKGSLTQQRYWVIIGSYTDKSKAQTHADRINKEGRVLKAFVGKRQPNNDYYPVIVGDYVSRQQAEKLVEEALQLKSVKEYGSAPYLSAYADRLP